MHSLCCLCSTLTPCWQEHIRYYCMQILNFEFWIKLKSKILEMYKDKLKTRHVNVVSASYPGLHCYPQSLGETSTIRLHGVSVDQPSVGILLTLLGCLYSYYAILSALLVFCFFHSSHVLFGTWHAQEFPGSSAVPPSHHATSPSPL